MGIGGRSPSAAMSEGAARDRAVREPAYRGARVTQGPDLALYGKPQPTCVTLTPKPMRGAKLPRV